ncbi:MAG TPA: 5'-methylthioadenosine/adenosylhomocysteine nucleosidase [Clostridia bacterium]|nr:5'-methylthioadenosine/adenosylhomocysteine nucleosidase [Clostridia bacterium]
MARIGIISAMPVEMEGFIKDLNAKEVPKKGFYQLYKGNAAENEIYLVCCGIGKVNAAISTQRLIDLVGVDYIINMGIAGGIGKHLKTLDVVIGTDVVYHDFQPPDLLDKYYPFTSVFECNPQMVELAEKVCAGTREVDYFCRGRIATGDRFVEAGEDKKRILEMGGMCCEMEAAAIAHAACVNNVPFLIIRSISDLADEGAQMSYNEFEKKASVQANRVVMGMINQL